MLDELRLSPPADMAIAALLSAPWWMVGQLDALCQEKVRAKEKESWISVSGVPESQISCTLLSPSILFDNSRKGECFDLMIS